MAQLLVAHGADLNIKTLEGKTPLDLLRSNQDRILLTELADTIQREGRSTVFCCQADNL
jgi:ankyrin repeat protein